MAKQSPKPPSGKQPEIGVFLAHAPDDHQEAVALKRRLAEAGWRVWLSSDEVLPGDQEETKTEQAMEKAALAIVCLSKKAVREAGRHHRQIKWALGRQEEHPSDVVFTIPAMLEACETPLALNEIKPARLYEADGFQRLIQALEAQPAPVQQRIRLSSAETGANPSSTGSTRDARPFRVALLSTEEDLSETRKEIADYLTEILSINVTLGPFPEAAEGLDLTVLLQGWLWEEGAAVKTWESVPKTRRTLFVAHEKADWPPRRLVERPCEDQIEAFRARNPGAETFNHPKELRELVGKHVSQKIQEQRAKEAAQRNGEPALPVGLSPVERAYLAFRLEWWREGRLGGKLYATEKIYQPDLYVPLDGESARWRMDEDGALIAPDREPPDKRAKSEEAETRLAPARLPLARWACLRETPWLALAGAPGAGKTVFLTAFAASLGSALLGREPNAAAEHRRTLEGLRTQEGAALPVPVTLEAVRLAEGDLAQLGALCQAVARELGAGSAEEEVDAQAVARGLRAGRYLLLIDALDEIPDERKRHDFLRFLRTAKESLGPTRIILATRAAEYTGEINLEPFELVRAASMNDDQARALQERFVAAKKEDPRFQARLAEAIAELRDRWAGDRHEDDLTGNPLMLTTVCAVYHRLKRLPKDRAELCRQLVEDLCQARDSTDPDQGWALDANRKRDLLERLALAMQAKGAQDWTVEEVERKVAEALPSAEARESRRLAAYVRWLSEHTGLLYFTRGKKNEERVRFHHRMFREHLAASELAKSDKTAEQIIEWMAEEGWLTDPFWRDVVGFLPGALNSPKKAKGLAAAMTRLSEADAKNRGRLLANLAAAVSESRHLFEEWDAPAKVDSWMARYKAEGENWELADRRVLLESVGALGDPRLDPWRQDRWVAIEPGEFVMGDDKSPWDDEKPQHKVVITRGYRLGRYPVTNHEFAKFIETEGYQKRGYWNQEGWKRLKKEKASEPLYWRDPKWNRPNQPVVGVSWHEAKAYCRWLEKALQAKRPEWAPNKLEVALPSEAQWEYAARGRQSRVYPWTGDENPNKDLANYGWNTGRITPVGTYPRGATPEGLLDMAGNVREWQRDEWQEDYKKCQDGDKDPVGKGNPYRRPLRGGAWNGIVDYLRASYRFRGPSWFRGDFVGFRCCLRPSSPERG